MKSQLAIVLFAFATACGGGSEKPAPVEKPPVTDTKIDEPIVEQPIKTTEPVVEVAKPELPKTYDEALQLGMELATKGEHPRAREMLELAAKLDRKKAEPQIELARSYIATSERANAIKAANKAVKLAPESSQAYNTLGRAELLRHNYENAIEAFRQSTELNKDNIWAWNNLGFTYLTLKKYDEAVTALVEATSHKNAEGYMFNNLGTAYEHMDQLDEARDAYEAGGKLGSTVAASSRKRLEGVDTIVVAKKDVETKPEENQVEEFEISEPMPDMPVDNVDEHVEEPKAEDSSVESKVEEPKAEEASQVEPDVVETAVEDAVL
jgi:Flp pilus assembly protein TadD